MYVGNMGFYDMPMYRVIYSPVKVPQHKLCLPGVCMQRAQECSG